MRRKTLMLYVIFMLFVPLSVQAGVPLDTVKRQVNKLLDILGDPNLREEAALKNKKEKIRSISRDFFNFTEVSKRTLGRNWKKLTSEQRKEFIALYRTLLEDTYMERILAYSEEKVVFQKEKMLTEKKAEVHTNIITKTAEIPVHYKLILKNSEWKVYDVVIEGISLIKNYRTQFKQILSNRSPEELLSILRKKVRKV